MNCYNCQKIVSLKKKYLKPLAKELKYIKKNYLRKIFKCKFCNHYMNLSNIDFKKIYKDSYSNISYGQNIYLLDYTIQNADRVIKIRQGKIYED